VTPLSLFLTIIEDEIHSQKCQDTFQKVHHHILPAQSHRRLQRNNAIINAQPSNMACHLQLLKAVTPTMQACICIIALPLFDKSSTKAQQKSVNHK
jgi:hypothetical protein